MIRESISPLRGMALLSAATILILLLSACGAGDGQGLCPDGSQIPPEGCDGSGNQTTSDDGGGSGGAVSGNPNATLDWVQDNVFGGICSLCHTGLTPPMGVGWNTRAASCANVNRPSGELDTLMEIDPGNPDRSYLIWKLEGAGPNGEPILFGQMPLNNPPLSADTINNVRDWISDGTPGCAAPRAAARGGTAEVTPETTEIGDEFDYSEGSWMHVWETSLRLCSTCHSVRPSNPACVADIECPPGGLVLDADNYYGIIDGRTVVPLDPDASRLWTRVATGDPGIRMPPEGYLPLSQAQKDVIRDWILDGAPLRPADHH